MNLDTWFLVFHSVYTKNDGLNIRIVCKESREAFKQYVNSRERIYPKRTFIALDTCMNCNGCFPNMKMMRYREEHPVRLLLHCENFDCFCRCFSGFMEDMIRETSYPFFSISSKEPFYVPRSEGGISLGIVASQHSIIEKNGELYCVVFFSRNVYKTILEASNGQGPYEYVLRKMIPLKSCESVTLEKIFLEFMPEKLVRLLLKA